MLDHSHSPQDICGLHYPQWPTKWPVFTAEQYDTEGSESNEQEEEDITYAQTLNEVFLKPRRNEGTSASARVLSTLKSFENLPSS